MRRIQQLLSLFLATMLLGTAMVGTSKIVAADTASDPSLIISQFKITSSNGQFITLYNAGPTAVDMSKYQLQYFNNYDLTKATSSRLVSLSGTLPSHGYFMISDAVTVQCYQMVVDSLSLGFSSTAGFMQLLGFSQKTAGGAASPVVQDFVGWSKTATAGAQTLPTSVNGLLQRNPLDGQRNPAVTTPGGGSWLAVQPSETNPCSLLTIATASPVQAGPNLLLPSSEPPATFVADAGDSSTEVVAGAGIPARDVGLMAPKISELLPNPDGTGNDSTDEYIELYNPNNVAFDLSGFVLQAGLTTLKSYTFPVGTMLAPQSFTAFYSEATGLSLSNTASQAILLDPLGTILSQTDAYKTAKDGQAWALANGAWYWSTALTPNLANVIKQPVSTKKTKATTKKTPKSTAAVKGAKTSKQPVKTVAASNYKEDPVTTPIHTKALVVIVGLAVLYGAYEYRTDMANRIYRCKRYLSARWSHRG